MRTVLLILIFFWPHAVATAKDFTEHRPKQSGQASADDNPISKALSNAGIRACANRAAQVIGFLGKNGKTGAAIFVAPEAPNQHLASISLEIIGTDQTEAYVSLSLSQATNGQGCSAVYDAVTWWPKSCKDVLSSQYPSHDIAGALRQRISVIKLDENARVFLVPTQGGCNAIKKEIVF